MPDLPSQCNSSNLSRNSANRRSLTRLFSRNSSVAEKNKDSKVREGRPFHPFGPLMCIKRHWEITTERVRGEQVEIDNGSVCTVSIAGLAGELDSSSRTIKYLSASVTSGVLVQLWFWEKQIVLSRIQWMISCIWYYKLRLYDVFAWDNKCNTVWFKAVHPKMHNFSPMASGLLLVRWTRLTTTRRGVKRKDLSFQGKCS